MLIDNFKKRADVFLLAEVVGAREDRVSHDHQIVVVAELAFQLLCRAFVAAENGRPQLAQQTEVISQILRALSPVVE